VFALVLAIVFFTTAFGFSFYVIWEIHSSDSTNSSNSSNNNTTTPTKLAGTKLAGFTPLSSVPVLKIVNIKNGTGAVVKSGATITVDYTGAIAATGVIFQSSLDTGQTATLSLNNVIEGWKLGIPGMRVGGERQLLIPAGLAYGASPPSGSNIPANANLVFNITLHSISS
jgi:FKBP-type peptidyl-prolyl cis-trans isomerase